MSVTKHSLTIFLHTVWSICIAVLPKKPSNRRAVSDQKKPPQFLKNNVCMVHVSIFLPLNVQTWFVGWGGYFSDTEKLDLSTERKIHNTEKRYLLRNQNIVFSTTCWNPIPVQPSVLQRTFGRLMSTWRPCYVWLLCLYYLMRLFAFAEVEIKQHSIHPSLWGSSVFGDELELKNKNGKTSLFRNLKLFINVLHIHIIAKRKDSVLRENYWKLDLKILGEIKLGFWLCQAWCFKEDKIKKNKLIIGPF